MSTAEPLPQSHSVIQSALRARLIQIMFVCVWRGNAHAQKSASVTVNCATAFLPFLRLACETEKREGASRLHRKTEADPTFVYLVSVAPVFVQEIKKDSAIGVELMELSCHTRNALTNAISRCEGSVRRVWKLLFAQSFANC